MPDDERSRLLALYRWYDADAATQRRWGDSPGNRQIVAERTAGIMRLLKDADLLGPRPIRVLEIGCGGGDNLVKLAESGVPGGNLHGVDLVRARLARAGAALPGARLTCADGAWLPYPDRSFDLVLLFTVLSSIRTEEASRAIATEARRVLRMESRGAGILWYDMRIRNPWNTNVRGIGRRELARLFPDLSLQRLHSITLLPPLARLVARIAPSLYRPLSAVPVLRSHYLGLLTPS
jgi:SAM-dependent methyltransferase